MSRFSFEGDFRRKPMQKLGGNSRISETKESVLKSAMEKRERRERERMSAAATVILQSGIRSYLSRKKCYQDWREEFDAACINGTMDKRDIESMERYISLFLKFYNVKLDNSRLIVTAKCVLANRDTLLPKLEESESWSSRIRILLSISLNALKVSPNLPPATFLRLIETYTSVLDNEVSTRKVIAVTKIWLHLLQSADFFTVWQTVISNKLPTIHDPEDVPDTPFTKVCLEIFERPLKLVNRLNSVTEVFHLKNVAYTGDNAATVILEKFTEAFSVNVIPSETTSGTAAYLILPHVAKSFPRSSWLTFLPDFVRDRPPKFKRQLLYTFLTLHDAKDTSISDVYSFLQVIVELLSGIDIQLFPEQTHQLFSSGTDVDDLDEDMETDQELVVFFTDCKILWSKLKKAFDNIDIAGFAIPYRQDKWNIICPIISCLLRMDSRLATVQFRFLLSLAYSRNFLRSIYIQALRSETPLSQDLLVFCWLLSLLMVTLHDAEFLDVLPFNKDELSNFIVALRNAYSDMIINERDTDTSMLKSVSKVITTTLMSLCDRNTRMNIFSDSVFVSPSFAMIFPIDTHQIRFNDFCSQELTLRRGAALEGRLLRVLKELPFALSFHDRVAIWQTMLEADQREHDNGFHVVEKIQIRRTFIYEDAFEKLSAENVRDMRGNVKISLVNTVGAVEAGIDGGGLLREFLTEATKAGVDPNRGLFRVDSQNRIYPNPIAKKLFKDYQKHYFLMGRLVGKALYEQTLLELPFAAFFIQIVLSVKVSSAVDYLATLDPALHKNVLALKNFKGDWNSLGIDFTITVEELGEARNIELKPGGKDIAVDASNVIEYIHLVADFKINKEIEEEARAFRAGLNDVVPIVRMFSWKEMQTLISGSDKAIDIEDWMANTNYGTGFDAEHETVKMFWEVVKSFDETQLRKLLKFVTSCSRPPLLGFKDLVPKFGIQNAGLTDRLPTASTCMNLLKLPQFNEQEILKEKLIYAINAQAGFELS